MKQLDPCKMEVGWGKYRTSLWDSQQVGRKVVSMATSLHSSKSQQVGGKVVSMVTWLLGSKSHWVGGKTCFCGNAPQMNSPFPPPDEKDGLTQWFFNLSRHLNHLESMLKTLTTGPLPLRSRRK